MRVAIIAMLLLAMGVPQAGAPVSAGRELIKREALASDQGPSYPVRGIAAVRVDICRASDNRRYCCSAEVVGSVPRTAELA